MTWKEKLASLGLTEETVSAGLRKKIAAYLKGESTLERLRTDAADESLSDDDREELEETAASYETVLFESEEALCAAIDSWYKNKDRYAEMAKHLKRSTASKPTAEPQAPAQTTTTEEPRDTARQEPAQATPTATGTDTPAADPVKEGDKKDEKKGSNMGLWLTGAVLLLTGGVVYLKTRD